LKTYLVSLLIDVFAGTLLVGEVVLEVLLCGFDGEVAEADADVEF
jgi:hypothetical protein